MAVFTSDDDGKSYQTSTGTADSLRSQAFTPNTTLECPVKTTGKMHRSVWLHVNAQATPPTQIDLCRLGLYLRRASNRAKMEPNCAGHDPSVAMPFKGLAECQIAELNNGSVVVNARNELGCAFVLHFRDFCTRKCRVCL
jgi:hypothetical protein